jgi:DNA-binding NtrC family response regulator
VRLLRTENKRVLVDPEEGLPLSLIIDKIIVNHLNFYDGNRTKTAKHLKIGLRTLQRRIKQIGEENL